MDNGDATQGHAMTPEEFAKLMGAYPQPAENPLPAYGGYMDNSPANFSFVEFNDYFGAETFEAETLHEKGDYRIIAEEGYDALRSFYKGMEEDEYQKLEEQAETYGMFNLQVQKKVMGGWETIDSLSGVVPSDTDSLEELALEWMEIPEGVDFDAETFEARDSKEFTFLYHVYDKKTGEHIEESEVTVTASNEYEARGEAIRMLEEGGLDDEEFELIAETFESPYAGAGSLFSIGQNTGLEGFTTSELTTSSAIHGDFDEASLNYSGHQNFEVRAESESYNKLHGWATTMLRDVKDLIEDLEDGAVYDLDDCRERLEKIRDDTSHLDAEMDMIDESNARIRNRFGDEIGMVAVDDHDVEDAVVEVSDGSDVIQEVIVSESETVKKSLLPLALGALAAVVAFPTVTSLFTKKQEKAAETPELIESPDTGNLDPAQYEELVVESTGYAVDVIPQGLDGSFMGSRFAALPTERYVDYNEPGIGAHTDIALNRDEIYLEPEMAMVQASENVIKEAQAPGQSPYNSMTGEENPDFDFRVVKETQVISLDPAVKPFIPQSMSGYTGNANTPPSVLNKMFNTGVLGQTPAFVPGSGDIGASHTGSRNATPNTLGLGGSVGGPLSDQVNANYTDGTTSMSLAQWSIENTVSQTSDTEAVVIDRSSGLMKRVRRV